MDGKAEIETERDVLKRIVALLFSFACLAERASGRSYPVRCLVLWFLRRAEVVARGWIADGSPDAMQSITPTAVLHRNGPAEAMFLAASFRALAHMLRRELHFEERLARRLMRGNARRSETEPCRRGPLTSGSFSRIALIWCAAMHCLDRLGFEIAPRLDTS
ncbi:MAG: hypothetical protein AB7P20_13800 [Rhizobiaceae bacterium]